MRRHALVIAVLLGACGSSPPPSDRATEPAPSSAPSSSSSSAGSTTASQGSCGRSPGDWCPAPAGDPCGAHGDADACRADARCEGMPYRGESLVACALDARCFASNCPTVGCVTRCEELDASACAAAAERCVWSGACARREPCAP